MWPSWWHKYLIKCRVQCSLPLPNGAQERNWEPVRSSNQVAAKGPPSCEATSFRVCSEPRLPVLVGLPFRSQCECYRRERNQIQILDSASVVSFVKFCWIWRQKATWRSLDGNVCSLGKPRWHRLLLLDLQQSWHFNQSKFFILPLISANF